MRRRRGGGRAEDTARARAKWRSASATIVAPLGEDPDEDGKRNPRVATFRANVAGADACNDPRLVRATARFLQSRTEANAKGIEANARRSHSRSPTPPRWIWDVDVSFVDGVRARAYDADGAALVEAEARTIDLTGERLGAPRAEPGGDRAREPARRFVADDVRVAVRQNLATNVPRVGLRRVFRAVRVGGSRGPALAPPPPPDAWATEPDDAERRGRCDLEPGDDLDGKRESSSDARVKHANTGEHSRDYYRDLRDLEFVGATWDAPCESVVAVDANFAAASSSVAESPRDSQTRFLGRLVREPPWFFVHEPEKGHAAHDDDGDADRRAGSRAREDARVRLPELDAASDASAAAAPSARRARCFRWRPRRPQTRAGGAWRVARGAWSTTTASADRPSTTPNRR